MAAITYRKIKKAAYGFLEDMLYEAIFVPDTHPKPPKSIIALPELKKYVEYWNQKKYDLAIVAENEEKLVGAIWGRVFKAESKGYGYVDDDTPEISMAVKENYRGIGIGTKLLELLEEEYSKAGIRQLSLSVDKANKAKKLYEKSGYQFYEDQNTAITMLKKL